MCPRLPQTPAAAHGIVDPPAAGHRVVSARRLRASEAEQGRRAAQQTAERGAAGADYSSQGVESIAVHHPLSVLWQPSTNQIIDVRGAGTWCATHRQRPAKRTPNC
jgi:hypothetical protein